MFISDLVEVKVCSACPKNGIAASSSVLSGSVGGNDIVEDRRDLSVVALDSVGSNLVRPGDLASDNCDIHSWVKRFAYLSDEGPVVPSTDWVCVFCCSFCSQDCF